MRNLIKLDTKEVELLKRDGVQVWLNAKGNVRITQRMQLCESYAIIKLGKNGDLSVPADTMYEVELLRLIKDNKWIEIKDAVICRESDVKELLE